MSRLVIVAPNWLGDAVMALPAIADVRRGSPGVTIVVAARPAVAALFTLVGDVDEVRDTHLRDSSSDVALLLPNSFRSALEASRAGIPERWGYRADCRGLLLTRAIERPPAGAHQVDYYQHLVRALGFANAPTPPRIHLNADVRDHGARALAAAGWDGRQPLVALAPGAAYGGAKRWPPDYFAALAREFAADGIGTVMVGSAADESTSVLITDALAAAHITTLNLVGRTDVPTLAGVLAQARALVANDSGAAHLGAAVGIPVTAIFGPTNEHLTAPRGAAERAILVNPVWCRPCMLRECPLDHACMRGMHIETVAAATRRMM